MDKGGAIRRFCDRKGQKTQILLHFGVVEAASNQAFDLRNGVRGVHCERSRGRCADEALFVAKGHKGRRLPLRFIVEHYIDPALPGHGHDAVLVADIEPDHAHGCCRRRTRTEGARVRDMTRARIRARVRIRVSFRTKSYRPLSVMHRQRGASDAAQTTIRVSYVFSCEGARVFRERSLAPAARLLPPGTDKL